jgi:hypothetical protein
MTLTPVGNNTGIVVPNEVLEELGAGKRPAVHVDVNGFRYQTTVGSMGGSAMISGSAAIRTETGLPAGDELLVALILATTPRSVEIPADLEAAFSANEAARTFFQRSRIAFSAFTSTTSTPQRVRTLASVGCRKLSHCFWLTSRGRQVPEVPETSAADGATYCQLSGRHQIGMSVNLQAIR